MSNASDDQARAATLSTIRIGLLDERGRRVTRDGNEVEVTLNDIAAIDVATSSGDYFSLTSTRFTPASTSTGWRIVLPVASTTTV